MSRPDFYRAFEDRFRGCAEVIESRLSIYLPFVQPVADAHPGATLTDLGCGRGEWLSLLQQAGIAARGVDKDDAMLAACRERGLSVERADAIDYLRGLPDGSQFAVSAFHFVEHVPLDALHAVASEAMRVLRPGGLLILETPNPESLIVSTTDFYLDPSHNHPIPPKLLAFLAEFHGFEGLKILRLQERRDLPPGNMSLWGVLTGTSPDYALIARKPGAAVTEEMAAPFRQDYGVSLEAVAIDYDIALRTFVAESRERLDTAHALAAAADAAAQEAHRALVVMGADLAAAKAQFAAGQAQFAQTDAYLRDVLQSRSWRITAPLRWAVGQLRRLRAAPPQPQPQPDAPADAGADAPAPAPAAPPEVVEPADSSPGAASDMSARARTVLREIESNDATRS